jgi:protein-tyrosine phosphatase
VLVLCAEEYQPRSPNFPGLHAVIHAPLDDAQPTTEEIDTAITAAMEIADRYRHGQNILITCIMGRNRSGLVSALALHFITGAPAISCAEHLRQTRRDPTGVRALSNHHFVELLRSIDVRPIDVAI